MSRKKSMEGVKMTFQNIASEPSARMAASAKSTRSNEGPTFTEGSTAGSTLAWALSDVLRVILVRGTRRRRGSGVRQQAAALQTYHTTVSYLFCWVREWYFCMWRLTH